MSKSKKLINRFLKGRSSEEEENSLELFEGIQLSKNQDKVFVSDMEKKRMEEDIFIGVTAFIAKKVTLKWKKIAAAVVIFLGLGIGYLNIESEVVYTEITNDSIDAKIIELEDGSCIVLNFGSSVKYADNFNDKDRQVELSGEAFFNVKRNEDKPLIVTTGELKTEVLGTSFNIKETDLIVNVTVSTGLVKVYDEHNVIRVKPNQEAIFLPKSNDLSKRNVKSELITSWYKEEVELNGVTMEELGELLQKRYQTKLTFTDFNLADKQLTIIIKDSDNIDTLIERINFINEVELIKSKNKNVIEVHCIK